MLNYIALFTATALVIGAVPSARVLRSTGPPTSAIAALPVLFGRDLHLGVLIAYAFVPIFWWFVWRTTIGFEIRTVGANPSAARYAGMSPRRLIIADDVAVRHARRPRRGHHLPGRDRVLSRPRSGPGIGFEAIAIALLGRATPSA